MSVHRVFTIYDMKAEFYMKPFFCLTPGEAIRSFSDAINETGSPFNRHPGDYNLYEVGKFDDATGQIEKISPVNLGVALNYVLDENHG